jgi:hypothetical protein
MAASKIGLPLVWMIALSLFTFVAYLPAMQGPFVFDDLPLNSPKNRV